MKRPLLVGLGVSAGVHAVVLGALLVSRSPISPPAPMRVRVLGARADPAATVGERGPVPPSPVAPERPRPVSGSRSAAANMPPERPSPERGHSATAARAAEGQTPVPTTERAAGGSDRPQGHAGDASRPAVQDDIWVITDDAPVEGTPEPASPSGSGGTGGPRGALSPEPSSGTGGSGLPSLLGELSRRLAWSAARCTPSGAVRSSRGSPPEVPLHFCLDASGRPSAVGLEGTTGSELLDRAARECVVPGAAPLPGLPGCYTVAVRFPIRQ